ncbi:DUF305 domain-containing protein [Luteimonas suaedae]|uniref:DUF305 domain-containing protein n=1 Tax=Luteimonas suaedae TaxID=2605430 RepID=UPI001CA9FFC2|nr:DUF305 domain-containing protein [Luteimonas suaedae]
MQMSYWRFAAMVATATVVMFGLMYLNTYVLDHVRWSEMRAWMALLMGATMAIVMLVFMLSMYKQRKVNIAIFAGSAVLFALCMWLVRSQATVSDVDYMKAMVPHHSIAILTSTRAQISDPRVRKLADEIIAAQRREIAEMKYLIDQLESGAGEMDALQEAEAQPRLVTAREAVTSTEVAMTDLEELDEAEIERVLGRMPRCSFRYSRAAGPVLALAMPAAASNDTKGVVKLHGRLVEMSGRYAAKPSPAVAVTLSADGMEVVVEPGAGSGPSVVDGDTREADAHLRLEAGLAVGYGGFYGCDARTVER